MWPCPPLLLIQQGLLLLSSMTQLSYQATSFGGSTSESLKSVVDYAIASQTTAPWFMYMTVDDAQPPLSYHCLPMLSLALPPPLAPVVSALTNLHSRWELGAQAC